MAIRLFNNTIMTATNWFVPICICILCGNAYATTNVSSQSDMKEKLCNGPYDQNKCTCPETKFSCACRRSENCIWGSGCIPEEWHNDNINHCGDWSDEYQPCLSGDYLCACANTTGGCDMTRKCYSPDEHCDDTEHCIDKSDELNCSCEANEVRCPGYGYDDSCYTRCIKNTWINDGVNDCGDWSDEPNQKCLGDDFKCDCFGEGDCRGCVNNSSLCNGYNDCNDWSDEGRNCSCPNNKFQCACYNTLNCTSETGWISDGFRCNGVNECGDWSDEINCTCKAHQFSCDCYDNPITCENIGGCIDLSRKCDGIQDCPWGEDERNCKCDSFKCACFDKKCYTSGCVAVSAQCDGANDCGDWSDEIDCVCTEGTFQCSSCKDNCSLTDRQCIEWSKVCDGWMDCADGSDEACNETRAWCGTAPISIWECDTGMNSFLSVNASPIFGYRCLNEHVCIRKWRIISNASQECDGVFQCEDGSFINNRYFCDVNKAVEASCNDDSDEQCDGFGFQCAGPSRKALCILPQANVYDSEAQCSDQSDLCFVNGEFRCFQCLDRKLIIAPKQVCDGVANCYDLSDECLCENKTVCHELRGPCAHNQIRCNLDCLDMETTLCNSSVKCNGLNTKYCSCSQGKGGTMQCNTGNGLEIARKCDGDPECLLFEDECDAACENPAAFCTHSCVHEIKSNWKNFQQSSDIRFCDGKVEKVFGTKHSRECPLVGEQFCNASRFYCIVSNTRVSVNINALCDGKSDCDDGSDEDADLCKKRITLCADGKQNISKMHECDGVFDCEDNSDESKQRCGERRFVCASGNVHSIDITLVENGRQDCEDGSDECVSLFSDRYEMIASPIFRACFWLMGFTAIFGNVAVFTSSLRFLVTTKAVSTTTKCTNMFILNLSAADFLMGVYLIGTVSIGVTYKGHYCVHDKEWRSSPTCSNLGALAIVSSEASAFTMTAMTTYRFISVYQPFTTSQMDFSRVTALTTLIAWGLAGLLAALPLFKFKLEYFQWVIWFPNYFFGSQEVQVETMIGLAKEISNLTVSNWSQAKQVISESFPGSVKGEFGYYGETSVCMPRLFATYKQGAWEYSLFMITINFLMFLYVFCVYGFIYKEGNRMNQCRNSDVSVKMQKRIFRLILTDFCCWIPVCIMGYLSIFGVKMPSDAYVASACILLPINSAINPLLYSKVIGQRIAKSKRYLSQKTSYTLNHGRGNISPKAQSSGKVEAELALKPTKSSFTTERL